MEQTNQNNNSIIPIIFSVFMIGVLLALYFFFILPSPDPSTVDISTLESNRGRELLNLMSDLDAISLDRQSITLPQFTALENVEVEGLSESAEFGRENPFAGVGF